MKHQIEQLIDRLADKTLSFGCILRIKGEKYIFSRSIVEADCLMSQVDLIKVDEPSRLLHVPTVYEATDRVFKPGEILGHPILLGDVADHVCIEDGGGGALALLTIYWKKCGARKSLQEIFDRAEWEEFECHINNDLCSMHRFHGLAPKQKEIRELFELLLTLKI